MPKTCWSRIRRFHNVAFVKTLLCKLHDVPRGQEKNVQKQAEQLRYCLIQAKEYYDAAQSVSLATKPVLMYYSIMSLALAEILLKHDGRSSLDKAPGENAHHGLRFHIDPPEIAGDQALHNIAQRFRATPLIKNKGKRFGTFELWHISSRELPILGELVGISSIGTTTKRHALIMNATDRSLPKLPASGVTLLDCLRYMPSTYSFLGYNNIIPYIVRAKIQLTVNDSAHQNTYNIVIHPDNASVLETFYEQIKIHPSNMYDINITELPSGLILGFTSTKDNVIRFTFPSSSTWTIDEVRFLAREYSLNEFGLFYVALYIAGNYARYYPDRWLADVDRAVPIALAIEELITQSEQRIPLLALSELSRNYFVAE